MIVCVSPRAGTCSYAVLYPDGRTRCELQTCNYSPGESKIFKLEVHKTGVVRKKKGVK